MGCKQEVTTAKWSRRLNLACPITQRCISDWVRDSPKWKTHTEENLYTISRHRMTSAALPQVERLLLQWLEQQRSLKMVVSGPILCSRLQYFAKQLGIEDIEEPLEGWLTRFKARYGVKAYVFHGEAGSIDPASVNTERRRLHVELDGYRPEDIFNADETGFWYKRIPNRGLSTGPQQGRKWSKARVTLLVAVNVTGTKCQEVFVGKSAHPRCFNGVDAAELGFHYYHNDTAWMNSEIYALWLQEWDTKLAWSQRNIVLLQDGFAGHEEPEGGLKYIHIVTLALNMTSKVQPLDQGIINTIKKGYTRRFMQRVIDHADASNDWRNVYHIELLEAMELLTEAWLDVTRQAIIRCWRKSGILPPNMSNKL